MSRPTQHGSLKKLSSHIKSKQSQLPQPPNDTVQSQRKWHSHDKQDHQPLHSSKSPEVRDKKAMSKLRIKSEWNDLPVGTNISHRPGGELKSPYYKALAYKKKRPHLNVESRVIDESSYRLQLEDFETAPKSGNYKAKNAFLPSERMKRLATEKPETPLTGKAKRIEDKSSNASLKRKKELNKYISESLEKLECYKDDQKKYQGTLKRQNQKRLERLEATVKGDLDKKQTDHSHSFRLKMKSKQKEEHIRVDNESPDNNMDIVFKNWKASPRKNKNPFDLTKQELDTFGERFPESFDKMKLLGRGGFSLVWLGVHKKSGKQFAVKQIKTQNGHQTHIKEIWFGSYFFDLGGVPKKEFSKNPGIKNLVKLYSYDIDKNDTWIFYEKCGESLGNALYDLQPETKNGERVYRMVSHPFYQRFKKDQTQLRKIIIQVSQALLLLSQSHIVHSDLKTQNILVKTDPLTEDVQEVKLIDYGSSFTFGNLKHFSMATPEYMAPQILNYILYQNQQEYAPKLLEFLSDYEKPWVIDTWSLGCVLFEIVSGIPLWMSLKTLVTVNGREVIKNGAFAVKGRLFEKIIKKQLNVVQNLEAHLVSDCYSGIILDKDIKHVMKRMLAIDPNQRISPQETIEYLSKRLGE